MRKAERNEYLIGPLSMWIFIVVVAGHLAFASILAAADRRISGTVVDSEGSVLKGVTITAQKNEERRTATDELGHFALNVPDDEITIRIEGQYVKP